MLDDHLTRIKSPEDKIRAWWKEKRFTYNLIVGSFGLLVIIIEVVLLPKTAFNWIRFLPFILLFGVLANLCYYIGQILDIRLYQSYTDIHNKTTGSKIFWTAVIFSISIIIWIQYIALIKGTSTPF